MKNSKNMLQNKLRSVRGFTLLELVIVIAIIGILAVIVLPNFINALGKARDAKKMSELRGMQTFLTTQGINTGLRYPLNETDFRAWASSTNTRLPQGFALGANQVYNYAGVSCDNDVPVYITGVLYPITCDAYQLWTELEQDNASLRLDSDLVVSATTTCTSGATGPCSIINTVFPSSSNGVPYTYLPADFNGNGEPRTGTSESCLLTSTATATADCVFDLVP